MFEIIKLFFKFRKIPSILNSCAEIVFSDDIENREVYDRYMQDKDGLGAALHHIVKVADQKESIGQKLDIEIWEKLLYCANLTKSANLIPICWKYTEK